ncbi:hypothetical protein [Nocardioides caldifontis]|uniref:hypothetical protein n=1 Tax=Nocardioides caldifontis TaxID=2588938 RepID=UPI0011E0528E|nr:hypothetical protein [Nocardioides caldifontis]
MSNDPLEALSHYPEPILDQLHRIARLAAGMSATEKAEARRFFAALVLEWAVAGPDDQIPAAEMVGALGQIVTTADALAATRKVA